MEDESSQNEDEKQQALKSLLFCDEEHRVQHDDDSKAAKLSENEASTNFTSDNTKSHGSSPSRHSPDPNCAICLGTLENKSFTDSCFHTFCFTCLVEWSKVKAECPLCKQPFKSIVHNVRSIEDYDQYYISSKTTDASWRGTDGRSFRYRSTLTSEQWAAGRHSFSFGDSVEYRTHRMTFAPHSVSFPTVRNLISECPSTSSYRRHIYENGLWVKPYSDGNTQRYRITSPEFYRQNPACTHRLTPWLNRELLALLYNSESQVTFVLELVLALIMRYDIRSEEFYVHIEPYLQHRASQFIHEFFNYASSLHDMRTYDSCAVYEKLEFISESSNLVSATTPSNAIYESSSPSLSAVTSLSSSSQLSRKKSKKSSRRQPKLFLRRNQDSNVWHSVLPTSTQSVNSTSSGDSSDYVISSSLQEFLDLGVLSGPSTSGLQITAAQFKKTTDRCFSRTNVTSGSSSDTEKDCIVVDIVKPRALRTPELVNLVSSSEDERTLDTDDVYNYCVATQAGESVGSLKRKEQEEEEAARVRGSKKKLKVYKKKSVSSSVALEFSNSENLISTVQSPISPPPHDQGILPSLPPAVCKTYVESDESHNVNKPAISQVLPLCLDILDSPPPTYDRHISCSSSSTECSQNARESEKTHSTNRGFSKVPHSVEDLPNSISSSPSSSITQMSNKMGDPLLSLICTKQGSELIVNNKSSLSLTHNEENVKEKHCGGWQHHNSSSASSVEENATFEVSENKGKLRSVICRFPANEHQNSRSDSSRHSSSRNKKHKHKKKKKKHGKHKHHKHSHSVSD